MRKVGSAAIPALCPLHPRALPAQVGRELVPVGALLRLDRCFLPSSRVSPSPSFRRPWHELLPLMRFNSGIWFSFRSKNVEKFIGAYLVNPGPIRTALETGCSRWSSWSVTSRTRPPWPPGTPGGVFWPGAPKTCDCLLRQTRFWLDLKKIQAKLLKCQDFWLELSSISTCFFKLDSCLNNEY